MDVLSVEDICSMMSKTMRESKTSEYVDKEVNRRQDVFKYLTNIVDNAISKHNRDLQEIDDTPPEQFQRRDTMTVIKM